MQLFFFFFRIAPQWRFCMTESPQYERSASAETRGSFPEILAVSALITTVSLPNWRQRATAGGEELGFKQYRLQEVQPSLLVVNSDINSNEYLGALPDCLSLNCYNTWGRELEGVFVCVSFCVLVSMFVGLCVTICTVSTSVYLCKHMRSCQCVPFFSVDMSNMQNNR